MQNYASIGICPICRQGRLIIARENRTGKIFVLCEDCESEWQSPPESHDIARASRDAFGESTLLTREDIVGHPWSVFLDR